MIILISPNGFAKEHQDDSYEELIELRGVLIEQILHYETEECNHKDEWKGFPTPDVKYLMNLQYLAHISILIAKKYNSDFILGVEK